LLVVQLVVPQLVGLQLVELLVAAQLVVRQLGPLVVQVHSQVPLVEWQQVAMQQLQNSSLVQILELGESPLLMHQQQVLYLLLELLNLMLLVSMF
jgi:hypothetical protein